MRGKTWLIILGLILLAGIIYKYGDFKPASVLNVGGTNRLIVSDVGGVGYDMDIVLLTPNKVVYDQVSGAGGYTRPVAYLNDDQEPLPRFTSITCLPQSDGTQVCLFSSKISGNRLKEGTNKVTFLYYYGDNPTLQYCLNSAQSTYKKFLSRSVDWNADCVNPPYAGGCNLGDAYCRNDFTSAVRDTFNPDAIFEQPLGGRTTHTFNVLSQAKYTEVIKTEVVEKIVYQDKIIYKYKSILNDDVSNFFKDNLFYILISIFGFIIAWLLLRKK